MKRWMKSTKKSKHAIKNNSMKKTIITLAAAITVMSCAPRREPSLKSALDGKFLIGAAINESIIRHQSPGADSVIFTHFNAIEPENCMKSMEIHPEKDVYNWELADKYVDYGTENGLAVYGHCLIWHSQLSKWFCVDENGNDVTPEELKTRMKEHISAVVSRYKGRIKGWDVVNEAIEDDGSWRQSPFYRILGEEFIPWAFQCAHEADPDVELYYNDYSMHCEGRFNTTMKLVKMLKERGLRIDAVGFQQHIGLDYPEVAVVEDHMRQLASLGVKICVTEWDLTALPTITMSADEAEMMRALRRPLPGQDAPQGMKQDVQIDSAKLAEFRKTMNPYPDGLPEDEASRWNDRAFEFWDMYMRNSDIITRINVWGVNDGMSWRNSPMRRDYTLLFDDDFNQKPVVDRIIATAEK